MTWKGELWKFQNLWSPLVSFLHRVKYAVFSSEATDNDLEKLRIDFKHKNLRHSDKKAVLTSFFNLWNHGRQTILDLIAVERRLPSYSESWNFLIYEKKIRQVIYRKKFYASKQIMNSY